MVKRPRVGRRAERRTRDAYKRHLARRAVDNYQKRTDHLLVTIESYFTEPKVHGRDWAMRQALYYRRRLEEILDLAPTGLEEYAQTIRERLSKLPWPMTETAPL